VRGLVLSAAILAVACGDGDRAKVAIQLQPRVVLDAAIDSIDLQATSPAISSTGYIAAQLLQPPSGGVGIFDAQGRFIRSVARSGKGPGELSGVVGAGFGPADTLWIIEHFALHAYTPPPHLAYVRTVRSATPMSGHVTPFGVLSAASVWGQRGVPLRTVPPVLTGWGGEEIARFGSERPQSESEAIMGPAFAVDTSHVWHAAGNAYEVRFVAKDRTVSKRIARDVEWFPPGLTTTGPYWESRPRPRIVDLTADAGGRVWVLITRAHPNWKADPSRPRITGPIAIASMPSRHDMSQYLESVIEVFDGTSGALLASQTLGGDVIGFASPGVLCRVDETADGRVVLKMFALSLSPE
jgi:hypothetical protein